MPVMLGGDMPTQGYLRSETEAVQTEHFESTEKGEGPLPLPFMRCARLQKVLSPEKRE
jgi:hypothetical protein